MANQWYYNREGQQQGPISDSELRKLANDGTLKTEDLIWKDGMAEWRKAGSVKGLFQKSTPSTPPPLPPNPSVPAEPEPVLSSTEKKSGATFGGSAKLAGQLTTKQTELTKIQQVSLPGQYVVVGSQAFEEGSQREEHGSLFAEIERLNNTISELERSDANQPEAKTFTDKAMALGGRAVTTTKLKAAQLQRRKKFIHLGKSIFDSGQIPSDCQQQKAEIERLLARADELQLKMAEMKGTLAEHGREAAASGRSSISSAAASGRSFLSSTAVVASLAVFCAPIGLLLIWRHPTWSKQTKLKWAGVSVGCFFVLGLFGKMQQTAALKELAAANQLWDDGEKNDAIDEYRKLIDKSSLPSSEKPQLYRRVIEFDCENDNLESARDLIRQSQSYGVKLNLTNQKAKLLQDDFEQELAEFRKEASEDQGGVRPSMSSHTKAVEEMAHRVVDIIERSKTWGDYEPENIIRMMQLSAGVLGHEDLKTITPSFGRPIRAGEAQGESIGYGGSVLFIFMRFPSGEYRLVSARIGNQEFDAGQ
jgi:cell division protein FtsB